LVVLIPSLLLLALLAEGAHRVLRARGLDRAAVRSLARRVDGMLEHKRGQPYAPNRAGQRLAFPRFNSRPFVWSAAHQHRTIFTFGGSSLVGERMTEVFPAELQRALNASGRGDFRVVNLGWPGHDSFSVRNRVQAVLEQARPGLVVIYSGHNDYTCVYAGNRRSPVTVRRSLYLVSDTLLVRQLFRLAHWWQWRGYAARARPDFEAYLKMFVEPAAADWLRRARLLDFPSDHLQPVNRVVLKHYARNIRAITSACRARGVPVLLVTPISNLARPPVGSSPEARRLYDRHYMPGELSTTSDGAHLEGLVRAKDLDVFNYDIRAKSALLNFLRSQPGDGVYLLDLERRLLAEGIDFKASFLDLVHMQRPLHRRVGRMMAAAILRRKLCCGLAAGP
jgi:lysophospholipase L1-like esterase